MWHRPNAEWMMVSTVSGIMTNWFPNRKNDQDVADWDTKPSSQMPKRNGGLQESSAFLAAKLYFEATEFWHNRVVFSAVFPHQLPCVRKTFQQRLAPKASLQTQKSAQVQNLHELMNQSLVPWALLRFKNVKAKATPGRLATARPSCGWLDDWRMAAAHSWRSRHQIVGDNQQQ